MEFRRRVHCCPKCGSKMMLVIRHELGHVHKYWRCGKCGNYEDYVKNNTVDNTENNEDSEDGNE